MVAHKSKSYDTRFDGDFSMNNHMLSKNENVTIFTQDAKLLIK